MRTDPKCSLVLAANWIIFEDFNHSYGKHSKKTNIIEDFLCGAKNQFKRNTKRWTETSKAGRDSLDDKYIRSITPDPVGNNRNSTDLSSSVDPNLMESSLYQKKMAASVSSPNLSKQDSSSSTGSSSRVINTMSEALRYNDSSQTEDSYRSGRSSQNSSNSSTLKHSKARKKPPSKAGTILSYTDRDIIVIDKSDINEATSDASNVIIVDPPATLIEQESNDIDLKDVLGKNWPTAAGDTATILNSDKKTQTPSNNTPRNGLNSSGGGYSSSSSTSTSSNNLQGRYERNKSLNPISHLANSKLPDGSRKREIRQKVDASTMASEYLNILYNI